jgi:hypothetical protein
MGIIKDRKKSATTALGATAAAVVVPALLFASAGTAQADGWITNQADYLGTSVQVYSDGVTFGTCSYDAVPIIGPGIPAHRQFVLPQGGFETLWFPGVKLNTTWEVTVACDHGGSFIKTTVY